jgi:hypothetical protein
MGSQVPILACVDPRSFARVVIRPSLITIALWTPAAEQLLLGTAIHESEGFRFRKQRNGPALGIFQMEPYTHDDIWKTYLHYYPTLSAQVASLLSNPKANKLYELEFNDKYAAGMARIKYARSNAPVPAVNDIPGMAAYWKRHYNTYLGKGTVKQFISDWNAMMSSSLGRAD